MSCTYYHLLFKYTFSSVDLQGFREFADLAAFYERNYKDSKANITEYIAEFGIDCGYAKGIDIFLGIAVYEDFFIDDLDSLRT